MLDVTALAAGAMWRPYLVEPQEKVARWSQHRLAVFDEPASDSAARVRLTSGMETSRHTEAPPDWSWPRCTCTEPCMADARIIEHRIGTRPTRDVVQVESGRIEDGTLRVHNYGHGCAGVTLCWGCANEVQALIAGHGSLTTTQRYLNPRELHQTGEQSQVARSRRGLEELRGYYELAV